MNNPSARIMELREQADELNAQWSEYCRDDEAFKSMMNDPVPKIIGYKGQGGEYVHPSIHVKEIRNPSVAADYCIRVVASYNGDTRDLFEANRAGIEYIRDTLTTYLDEATP
jgi:hypothetical protein